VKLELGAEVAAALAEGLATVALESTLVAHGLPWPDNLAIARELEEIVRAGGAVPATIAVVDGTVHVGLSPALLERLAQDGTKFAKAAMSDVAVHVARKSSAATTVSATATIAAAAKIRVFATGGIGGVHRGDSGDVSQDLTALSRTPIAVVSAGAKAILDLPRTLEMLETLGVLVIGYRTQEFPAFYTRRSGLTLEHRVDTVTELAAIAREHWSTVAGGILVCNPIPEEADLDITSEVERSLAVAVRAGISGKRLTPYLLDKIAGVTGGESIRANRALVASNARVAAELAVALAQGS
jgi:pseudouridine-5'-phosphate glycosidase